MFDRTSRKTIPEAMDSNEAQDVSFCDPSFCDPWNSQAHWPAILFRAASVMNPIRSFMSLLFPSSRYFVRLFAAFRDKKQYVS
jgi:hypothetical protein